MRDFRIVVAAHGQLGHAFLESAALIVGRLEDATSIDLDPDDTPERFLEKLLAAAGNPDRPLLILTDLTGGTPHNVSLAATRRLPRAVVISGINLAVLIEAAVSMETLDAPSIERLLASGREALVDATQLLSSRSH